MRACPRALPLFASVLLSACGSLPKFGSGEPARDPAAERALTLQLLPEKLAEREAWADDLLDVFGALKLSPDAANLCAVIAVTEQESSFRVDPVVPNLSRIALTEIETRAAKLFVPKALVHAALARTSPTGKTYRQRLDAARTEKQLSEIYDDFIGDVPLGRRLLADYNPVRTGGPMQVSIAFSESYAADHRYPFGASPNVRREIFTRRGGLYFGTAHLLDYPADYDAMLYRFADFNAGHYASRNAAFQSAVALTSGVKLSFDGDLLLEGGKTGAAGETEKASRSLAQRLRLDGEQIRRDLERGERADFSETPTWRRVFELAEKQAGRALPRAITPQIRLQSPKITRQLTTDWFARRVDDRHGRCLQRAR
ncbi:MAG: DUF1615 domain-containing protein [Steroidobacteraceae bacterium]